MIVSIIVAVAKNGAIGKGNELLWKLPSEMRYFRETTSGHTVIMGRKTFESIGRPLPNRLNIVITRQEGYRPEGVTVVNSLEEALDAAGEVGGKMTGEIAADTNEVFVIGGAEIYRQALPRTDRVYLTRVDADFEGDAFFPDLDPAEWRETSRREGILDEKNALPHTFSIYERMV